MKIKSSKMKYSITLENNKPSCRSGRPTVRQYQKTSEFGVQLIPLFGCNRRLLGVYLGTLG